MGKAIYLYYKTGIIIQRENFSTVRLQTSLDPANKGSPVCISTSIHPNDHMSIARSYGIPKRTSGDR